MIPRSGSEGRGLQHEGAGPGEEAVLLSLPAVGDPAPTLSRCQDTGIDSLALVGPGQ